MVYGAYYLIVFEYQVQCHSVKSLWIRQMLAGKTDIEPRRKGRRGTGLGFTSDIVVVFWLFLHPNLGDVVFYTIREDLEGLILEETGRRRTI